MRGEMVGWLSWVLQGVGYQSWWALQEDASVWYMDSHLEIGGPYIPSPLGAMVPLCAE